MRRYTLAWLLALVLLGGCYNPSSYSGDGTLVETYDYGSVYKVSLGEIDLTSESRSTSTMAGLPSETFTIGLALTRNSGNFSGLYDPLPLDPIVRVRLVNERGQTIIDETLGLATWSRVGALYEPQSMVLYLTGEKTEVPNEGGGVRVYRAGELADGGWGSSFDPRSDGSYRLELSVIRPDPNGSDYRVELIAFGGQRFFI